MKVINKTHWQTKQLRAILSRCLAEEIDDPAKRKRVKVTVKYTRNRARGSSGYAQCPGICATVRIGRDNPDKVDFAYVASHEFAHLRGMTHAQMRGSGRYRRRVGTYRQFFAWASEMPLEKKQPAPIRVLDLTRTTPDEMKLQHAERMIRRWEAKRKFAQTWLRKWSNKAKYYQKKVAASEPPEVDIWEVEE